MVEAGWLAALVAPLGDRGVGDSGGRILSGETCNRIARFGGRIHDQRRAIGLEGHPYVASGNWASRREVLLEVGLFDPALLRGQGVDLAWRIHKAGYRLVYAPDAIVRHRNERTIRGLMHEGFVHGLHGARLLAKHGHARSRKRRRLRRALERLVREHDLVNGVLAMLFDVGKVTGQLVAHWRNARGSPTLDGSRELT